MGTNYILLLLGVFLCLAPILPKRLIYRDGANTKIKNIDGYVAGQKKLLAFMGILFLLIGFLGIATGKEVFYLIIIPVILNMIGGMMISKKYSK